MSERTLFTVSADDTFTMQGDVLRVASLENLGVINGEGDIWLDRLVGGRERIAQTVTLHFSQLVRDEFLPAVDLFGADRVVLGVLALGAPGALKEPTALSVSVGGNSIKSQ